MTRFSRFTPNRLVNNQVPRFHKYLFASPAILPRKKTGSNTGLKDIGFLVLALFPKFSGPMWVISLLCIRYSGNQKTFSVEHLRHLSLNLSRATLEHILKKPRCTDSSVSSRRSLKANLEHFHGRDAAGKESIEKKEGEGKGQGEGGGGGIGGWSSPKRIWECARQIKRPRRTNILSWRTREHV